MSILFPIPTATTEPVVCYARVAVERNVDQFPDGLTYAVPSALAEMRPGDRVIVPLGRGDRPTPGYVIEVAAETDVSQERLKRIIGHDASAARLPLELLDLAKWISSYYCAPIGMTLASMLPAAVKRNVGSVRRTYVDLAHQAGSQQPKDQDRDGAVETGTPGSSSASLRQTRREAGLSPKQRAVMECLSSLPDAQRPIEVRTLAERAGLASIAPIKALVQRGVLRASTRSVIEAAWSEHASDAREPAQLTDEQQNAIGAIQPHLSAGFSTHLLFGVTGSGKTEVYIRLIQQVIASGRVALMLVPEISLTPQTGGRLIGRFPRHRVAILHSGLTEAQRHQQWAFAAEAGPGGAHIILGARSAIFAPVPDGRIGLIIVDEEHDGSYKQDQTPRYHGRDVAIRRAQIAGCPIVLGSATPSLESWHNAIDESRLTIDDLKEPFVNSSNLSNRQSSIVNRRYHLHRLTQRAPGLRLPKVQVVDFREQTRLHKDKRVHLLGPALETAITRTLDSNGQVLILLNRRGFANYIACPSSRCGWTMTCEHCDVTVVYHLNKKLPTGGYVRCHHCLSEQKLPACCPQCNGKITTFGLGTQRIEQELAHKFPQLVEGKTMLRVDSDSMHGARDFHSALSRFGAAEVRLLLGTQMIAKGLDFPGVRLVGVINADTSINLPDFRASERTFQLVNQVAGRCGRGSDPGLTIVQTFHPNAPAIRLAAAHDYESFAQLELAERQRSGLPPVTRMTRIVLRDEDHVKCIAAARALTRALEQQKLSDQTRFAEVRIRGPAPCPIARIADKHRQQVEVFAPTAAAMQRFLVAARNAGHLRAGAEMVVDVDPIALL